MVFATIRTATLTTLVLLLSFQALPALAEGDDPCAGMNVRPLLVTESGKLPLDWMGERPAAVVSWEAYLPCEAATLGTEPTEPQPASNPTGLQPRDFVHPRDTLHYAVQAVKDLHQLQHFVRSCVPDLDPCVPDETPTPDPGVALPFPGPPLGMEPAHVAAGHYQVITMPSQLNNKPSGGCHYTEMNDARTRLQTTFFISSDFSCWLDWKNNEGNTGNDASQKNAAAYATAKGWNSANYLVMGWVKSMYNNGYAAMPYTATPGAGHVAATAETCSAPLCYNWNDANAVQHELSHLLNADHTPCGTASIMNICTGLNAGAFNRNWDRTNMIRICAYSGTCYVP